MPRPHTELYHENMSGISMKGLEQVSNEINFLKKTSTNPSSGQRRLNKKLDKQLTNFKDNSSYSKLTLINSVNVFD